MNERKNFCELWNKKAKTRIKYHWKRYGFWYTRNQLRKREKEKTEVKDERRGKNMKKVEAESLGAVHTHTHTHNTFRE